MKNAITEIQLFGPPPMPKYPVIGRMIYHDCELKVFDHGNDIVIMHGFSSIRLPKDRMHKLAHNLHGFLFSAPHEEKFDPRQKK